jgi:integrase
MTESRKLVRTKTPGVYKRGDGYVVRYRDPAGKDRKRCARTLAEARRIRAEVHSDISRGEYRTASKINFSEYATTWSATYTGRTSRGVRPDTVKRYHADLDRVIVPWFGRMRLAEVEPRHLKQFLAHLFEQGLSVGRVRNVYAPLRALLRTAVEEGVIRHDPTAGVRVSRVSTENDEPTDSHVEAFAYSEEELARFMQELPDRWRLFGRFLAQTGLRVSEATALRWQDVDFANGRVKVTRRLYLGAFAPPKSRYGRRSVPMNPHLVQDLWEARKTALSSADEAPLFTSSSGGYLDYSNVYNRILAPAQRRAGVKTGAHALRHTCATMLFNSGWNAKQVQVFLGHHSPAFTLSVYVHLLPDDLPAAPSFSGLGDEGHSTPSREAATTREATSGLGAM